MVIEMTIIIIMMMMMITTIIIIRMREKKEQVCPYPSVRTPNQTGAPCPRHQSDRQTPIQLRLIPTRLRDSGN